MIARLCLVVSLVTAVTAFPSLVRAYCTYRYNPWAAACDESDGEAACQAIWDAELASPSVAMHAIPVYLNFDTTPFPHDHPNYPGDPAEQIQIHRSLELTGLSKQAVTTQVRAALAQWNQSAAGHPMLYLAGEAYGDSHEFVNRPIGITIYSSTCFNREPTADAVAASPKPGWQEFDGFAYRGRIAIAPYLHSVQDIPAGTCNTLPEEFNPLPEIPCPDDEPDCEPEVDFEGDPIGFTQKRRTSRIRDGFQSTLVHEIGHTLGLQHNFFGQDESVNACGLGQFGTDTFGVMSYAIKYTNIRRDDAEAVHDLYGSYLPDTWPMQAWRRLHLLPASAADEENTLSGLETSVMPVLSNQVVSPAGMVAIAYADQDHQVLVRTISLGVLDPVVGGNDVPLGGEPGKTFTPPAVALRGITGAAHQVFVAWNVDSTQELGLQTRWALRNTAGGAWQVFGPLSLGAVEGGIAEGEPPPPGEPDRHHAPLGATFDPVHQDYVVVTMSEGFRPAISSFDTSGNLIADPFVLRRSTGPHSTELVDDYNGLGAPVCVSTSTSGRSLCLLPIATSGDVSRVGVLTFARTQSATGVRIGLVSEWLADTGAIGFGNVTLSWNDRTNQGALGYVDDRGDVRWRHVVVDARDSVSFFQSPWIMRGNGNYTPEDLIGEPREVVDALQSSWPACPYWSASSGGAGYDIPLLQSWMSVARGLCHGTCGDGFIDGPPWGNEECDGDNLGGDTCQDYGFDGGTLACGPNCNISVGGCFDDPKPDPGDCEPVMSCIDLEDDGCYPDGPGSYGKNGDGNAAQGFYCSDAEGPAVCGFTIQDRELVPTCLACPEPGSRGRDAAYGCSCESDADCAPTGLASTDSAPNGTDVPLACFGSTEQGWQAGNGRCLPAIDPAAPQGQTEEMAAREEFERTRWLCKQNCDSLEEATGVDYLCHYRQGGLDLTYAACVDAVGCEVDGMNQPGGACEEWGGACGPESGVCEAQCVPAENTGAGNAGCAARGFPSWYECAVGWAAEGFCVPPECVFNPIGQNLDLSECQQFVNAEIF
jgi:hypothetical protein